MGKKSVTNQDRARQVLAQESARIIVEQGIEDYRLAKIKAAERLGLTDRGSLPGNREIEQAVAEYRMLFQGEDHENLLTTLRRVALSAMEFLSAYSPRLVGPVLAGTAGEHSVVNLHLFADSAEQVAFELHRAGIEYRPFERRYKSRRGQSDCFSAFAFVPRRLRHRSNRVPVRRHPTGTDEPRRWPPDAARRQVQSRGVVARVVIAATYIGETR